MDHRDHNPEACAQRRKERMETRKEANSKGTILIADYDFGDVNIERAIIESAGFELVAAQCKSEDEVIEHGRHADGVLAQYAPIGARAIGAFARCRVIARYGTGVDIVDVDAATRRGIQVTRTTGAPRRSPTTPSRSGSPRALGDAACDCAEG
jgi:D-isomer specific 2-hydroxyacid dehydrogenase, catalytic domain